jgi:AraC family transcriptional regulator of adaptative response/methylated-DNA-[protein]-cysteine methyltransferase
MASTTKGICHISFIASSDNPLEKLKLDFPNAHFVKEINENHHEILSFFNQDWTKTTRIKLHLKGTNFQLKVWEALLKIPKGELTSYGDIAHFIDSPKSSRAVGTAIGKNPIAFLIPCHRVIRSSGVIGEYRWGANRKKAMIAWEGLK